MAIHAIHKKLHTITECHIITYYCIISQNIAHFSHNSDFLNFLPNHKVPKRRLENSQPILNGSLENKIRAKCLSFWNGFGLIYILYWICFVLLSLEVFSAVSQGPQGCPHVEYFYFKPKVQGGISPPGCSSGSHRCRGPWAGRARR